MGALVIGQAPRADLVGPLEALLPDCELVQAGALDGMVAAQIRFASAETGYPLSTRLVDGTLVMVEEGYIAGKLQGAVARLEAQGVCAIILLCAGTFATLHSHVPLIKPFGVGQQMLDALGYRNVGFITPVAGQEPPIAARWEAAGFRPNVWHANLNHQDAAFNSQLQKQIDAHSLDCIVLDYVGLAATVVKQLKAASPIPIVDLGDLAIQFLAGLITHPPNNG